MKTELFNRLPIDITIYISSYFDNIFYYKTKFIIVNKIDKNDERYKILKSIKRPSVEVTSNIIYIVNFICNRDTNFGFHLVTSYNLYSQDTVFKIIKVKIGKFRGAYREYLHKEAKYYLI